MTAQVVTRFAPSPTGFLHIGSARTALFNWAFARNQGGKFLLRIEDTDRARSTQEAVDAILDGLKWLELDWDGEPLHQFARAARHVEIAQQLLGEGNAYRCYCTPAELEAMRENARKESRPPVYDGTWRDRDPREAPKGVKPAIRLKVPKEGETVVDDRVQGRVVTANKELDDLIILRSDGTPTYNLAVVVDDHDMGVTHVIRGSDHLTNAARQSQIYAALGWDVPIFAHVPLIHGPDGAKLSKRHGALGVEAYRAMGYLPAAMRNYLARLGWSHGDDEIFTTDQLVEWFNLEALGKSPARFDFAKLESLNGNYIRSASDEELVTALQHLLPHKLMAAMPQLKARAATLNDLIDGANFLFTRRPLKPNVEAIRILTPEACAVLAELLPKLKAAPEWTVAGLEALAKEHAQDIGVKLGEIAQPLRAALTGRKTSPGIFDVLVLLGRDESLARLQDQAGQAAVPPAAGAKANEARPDAGREPREGKSKSPSAPSKPTKAKKASTLKT